MLESENRKRLSAVDAIEAKTNARAHKGVQIHGTYNLALLTIFFFSNTDINCHFFKTFSFEIPNKQ